MRKKQKMYFSRQQQRHQLSTLDARFFSFFRRPDAWAWDEGRVGSGCRFWMSFGGGGQAVGQGGRPSGTSKVQHFPSTTDSEFRRKASRQTRGKKFIASPWGCWHGSHGFAMRQRRSGLPWHSVWLLMLLTSSFQPAQVDSDAG